MRYFLRISIVALSIFSTTRAEQKDTSSISLLFIGDIMGHDTQINSAYNPTTKSYDYTSSLKYIEKEIKAADIAIANLEVTLAGPPFKGYPQFSSPDALPIAMKQAGVDVFVTANNHSCDRRRQGFERTIDILDSLNIPHTGTFKNQQDKNKNNPLILEKNSIKLALLNYTYGTNGIPVSSPNMINLIDTTQISKDILKAKLRKPDQIIAFMHWGVEYQLSPSKKQKQLAAFLLNKGVNIVIGSHPHVVQKMERKKNADGSTSVIVYSLGNFVSNQRPTPRDGGAMARIEVTKTNSGTTVTNSEHILTWVYPPIIKGKKQFYILPLAQFEKDTTFISPSYHKKMIEYATTARKVLNNNVNFPEKK